MIVKFFYVPAFLSVMMHSIVFECLSRCYNDFLALDNLSLKVKRNDNVALVGPNGAGKTTALKILCGLLRPSSGTAYINGINVLEQRERALSDVGAIVETPEFYSFFTPNETLSYLGMLRGMQGGELESRINQVLRLVKLDGWAGTRIEKFSRGMKQRLAIAQALLNDPSVLILDEPTLGLDPRGMVEMRGILREARKKKTVLFASHLLGEVTRLCDKVALIDHGRLLAYDTIDNLKKRYHTSLEGVYLKLTEGAV